MKLRGIQLSKKPDWHLDLYLYIQLRRRSQHEGQFIQIRHTSRQEGNLFRSGTQNLTKKQTRAIKVE